MESTPKTYLTKELAKLTGVHPNTVRLYETWGFISSAQRAPNKYRIFTDRHLDQMRIARLALPGPYPLNGRGVQQLVREFARDNLEASLNLAKDYLVRVEAEKARALQAMAVLDQWFEKKWGDKVQIILRSRKKVAGELGVTVDALRTWERNGLFVIPKDEQGRLAFSEWDLEKIKVIRLLRNCGYSIVSLLRVFSREENLQEKPSVLLSLPDNDEDFFYVTDLFMQYLEQHLDRARRLIEMISKAP